MPLIVHEGCQCLANFVTYYKGMFYRIIEIRIISIALLPWGIFPNQGVLIREGLGKIPKRLGESIAEVIPGNPEAAGGC
jgi:hypothetical protein